MRTDRGSPKICLLKIPKYCTQNHLMHTRSGVSDLDRLSISLSPSSLPKLFFIDSLPCLSCRTLDCKCFRILADLDSSLEPFNVAWKFSGVRILSGVRALSGVWILSGVGIWFIVPDLSILDSWSDNWL